MENKNIFFMTITLAICIFSILFAVFLFRHVKKVEFVFNEKEADLIRESMDLQDRIKSIKDTVKKKTKELDIVKAEKESMFGKLQSLEAKNEELRITYAEKIKTLEEKTETLNNELKNLAAIPIAESIKKAINTEEDPSIKKVLERTLHNIELVKSGSVVDLEPIVIADAGGRPTVMEEVSSAANASVKTERPGEILSIDRDNNLIVISLGTKDRVKEGQRLAILDAGEQIASGEIISSRYMISAAFIDDIKYKHTVHDIKEGYKVLIGE
ncbi:MAG: hypothetical protein NG740_02080 [Omnitrophica bacterium]|nr:hypothetical protein [Candidatus Omnitrophota bacterium]